MKILVLLFALNLCQTFVAPGHAQRCQMGEQYVRNYILYQCSLGNNSQALMEAIGCVPSNQLGGKVLEVNQTHQEQYFIFQCAVKENKMVYVSIECVTKDGTILEAGQNYTDADDCEWRCIQTSNGLNLQYIKVDAGNFTPKPSIPENGTIEPFITSTMPSKVSSTVSSTVTSSSRKQQTMATEKLANRTTQSTDTMQDATSSPFEWISTTPEHQIFSSSSIYSNHFSTTVQEKRTPYSEVKTTLSIDTTKVSSDVQTATSTLTGNYNGTTTKEKHDDTTTVSSDVPTETSTVTVDYNGTTTKEKHDDTTTVSSDVQTATSTLIGKYNVTTTEEKHDDTTTVSSDVQTVSSTLTVNYNGTTTAEKDDDTTTVSSDVPTATSTVTVDYTKLTTEERHYNTTTVDSDLTNATSKVTSNNPTSTMASASINASSSNVLTSLSASIATTTKLPNVTCTDRSTLCQYLSLICQDANTSNEDGSNNDSKEIYSKENYSKIINSNEDLSKKNSEEFDKVHETTETTDMALYQKCKVAEYWCKRSSKILSTTSTNSCSYYKKYCTFKRSTPKTEHSMSTETPTPLKPTHGHGNKGCKGLKDMLKIMVQQLCPATCNMCNIKMTEIEENYLANEMINLLDL